MGATRECIACKEALPLLMFKRCGRGRQRLCRTCEHANYQKRMAIQTTSGQTKAAAAAIAARFKL